MVFFPSQPFYILAGSSHIPVCSLKRIRFPIWTWGGESYQAKLYHNTNGDQENQRRGEYYKNLGNLVVSGAVLQTPPFHRTLSIYERKEFITICKFRSLTGKALLIQTTYQLAPPLSKNLNLTHDLMINIVRLQMTALNTSHRLLRCQVILNKRLLWEIFI